MATERLAMPDFIWLVPWAGNGARIQPQAGSAPFDASQRFAKFAQDGTR
jgi:hypothetical protein